MEGENLVFLESWDSAVVLARVSHFCKNIEGQTAHSIMPVLFRRTWITRALNVVADARKNGFECDDSGVLMNAYLMTNILALSFSSGIATLQ